MTELFRIRANRGVVNEVPPVSIQIREIVDAFPELLTASRMPPDAAVADIQTGSTASAKSLVFASTAEQLREAEASSTRAIVVPHKLAAEVSPRVPTVLVARSPQLAMAKVARKFFPQTRSHRIVSGAPIHERAVISPSASLGRNCIVGPGAVLGDDVEIGDDCIIGANAVLEPGVKIGAGTHVHPLVFIGHGCVVGRNCEIQPNSSLGMEGFGYAQDETFTHHRLTHYGRVILEDDVHIGAGVQMDRGTFEDSRVGKGTKIDNHCHFGHNIRIGEKTLITAAMVTAGSTTIGNACVFGGRMTIKGHLSVCDRAHFAGIGSIGKDVTEPGEYGGHPMQKLPAEMRTRAALKKLPDLVRQVRKIMTHLKIEDTSK